MTLRELLDKYDDHGYDTVTIFCDKKWPLFQDWLVQQFIETYRFAPIMSCDVLFFGFFEERFYIHIKEEDDED